MWYFIGYVVIAALTAAVLTTFFGFNTEDEDELFLLVLGTLLWPIAIAVGIFILLFRAFCLLIKAFEKLLKLAADHLKEKL